MIVIVGFRRKAREVQYCVQKDAYEGRLIDREGCKGGDETDVTGLQWIGYVDKEREWTERRGGSGWPGECHVITRFRFSAGRVLLVVCSVGVGEAYFWNNVPRSFARYGTKEHHFDIEYGVVDLHRH